MMTIIKTSCFCYLIAFTLTLAAAVPVREQISASERILLARQQCLEQITTTPQPADDLERPTSFEYSSNKDVKSYLRCVVSELGIWTDEQGYQPKAVAKLFAKRKMGNEIMVVVAYCNESQRHADAAEWAYNAYRCAAAGRIGTWIKQHIQHGQIIK